MTDPNITIRKKFVNSGAAASTRYVRDEKTILMDANKNLEKKLLKLELELITQKAENRKLVEKLKKRNENETTANRSFEPSGKST